MKTTIQIQINGNDLSFDQFRSVVFDYKPIALSTEAATKISSSRHFIEQCIQSESTIYGITTGFGKFSDQVINPSQSEQLQLNLIKSHACGVGKPLSEAIVRGMMLLRINALAKGYSGVRVSTVQTLIDLLNHQIHPIVPSQGSLGASGDLAPLSHICLTLLGLGDVIHRNEKKSALEAFHSVGLLPISLMGKEGLALINGTQMMCSILAICVIATKNLLLASDIIGSMTLEALSGIPRAYHPLLHQIRGQKGQMRTASNLLKLLDGSERVTNPGERRVQDAYSLRCIPQVHGASKDAYQYVSDIVNIELNAATDNPLIFLELEEVISGGNFHGQPLALAADFLAIAMAEIANISERRIERLVNPQLSELPAFLTEAGGLNSGYMILQYTAASLVSENKALAHPASVDSIPSSANQEDHVSMGSIAARKCMEIIENVTHVLAIEYICAAQALEFGSGSMGRGTEIAYELIRESIPALEEGRECYKDIEKSRRLIERGTLVEKVLKHLDLKE